VASYFYSLYDSNRINYLVYLGDVMKKILIFCCLFFLFPSVYAANVEVLERDENTLDVWEDIDISNNYSDIMSTPNVEEKEKIYDFANLFSDSEEEELFDLINDFIDEYNIDMIVVTIDENNKGSTSKYADDFFDYNYFGIGDDKDGVIYLIDMDNREIFISTNGSAVSIYNDDIVDLMLDECYADVSINDYSSSVMSFVKISKNYYEEEDVKSVNWVVTIILSLIFPTIIVYTVISSYKNIKLATKADDYFNDNLTKYGFAVDNFISTSTNRVKIKNDSRNVGRSVSTRRSSSGEIHGGRGRSF